MFLPSPISSRFHSLLLHFFIETSFLPFSLQIGITLIEVPYWWDGRRESLASTIHQIRSDITPSNILDIKSDQTSNTQINDTSTTEEDQLEDKGTSIPYNKRENHKLFFDRLSEELNIKEPSDWYKVTKDEIASRGGEKILQKYYNNSLYKVTEDKHSNSLLLLV